MNRVRPTYNEGTCGRAVPDWLAERIERFAGRRLAELIEARSTPDPHAVTLYSNDYLALATHPAIVAAQRSAIAGTRDALWMSSVFFAKSSPQRQLEQTFAQFLDAEDCVLAQSGYCANIGLLQSIARPGDAILIDECAHASLFHGVLASHARFRRWKHNQLSALEALLSKESPAIVIVDSIYSHDGSVCPLREVVELAQRYDCLLVVDESHALGTHGPRGAGLLAALGLADAVHFRTASLAKAFVARAGLIAASEQACWLVRHAAGPAIFSSSCMPHDLAGLSAALELITCADDRRRRLFELAARLRGQLRALGYDIASHSQIVSIESGLEAETIRLRQFLESQGIFGSTFCAPATRPHRSSIRFSLHAGLRDVDLAYLVDVCSAAREHVGFQDWASTRRARNG